MPAHPALPMRILASGDIGPDTKLLQPAPEAPSDFDYVMSESTYGDQASHDVARVSLTGIRKAAAIVTRCLLNVPRRVEWRPPLCLRSGAGDGRLDGHARSLLVWALVANVAAWAAERGGRGWK